MFNDFANWKIGNVDRLSPLEDEDMLNVYMEEKYAMPVGKGNVFDTIKAMNSPPSSEDGKDGNMVDLVTRMNTCAKRNTPGLSGKRKRDAGEEEAQSICSLDTGCFNCIPASKPEPLLLGTFHLFSLLKAESSFPAMKYRESVCEYNI